MYGNECLEFGAQKTDVKFQYPKDFEKVINKEVR